MLGPCERPVSSTPSHPTSAASAGWCPLILADLAAELPPAEWPGASFCDPMCGGGAVTLAAKAQGFEVYASDRARRGAIVAAALIANSSVRLREADWHAGAAPG